MIWWVCEFSYDGTPLQIVRLLLSAELLAVEKTYLAQHPAAEAQIVSCRLDSLIPCQLRLKTSLYS